MQNPYTYLYPGVIYQKLSNGSVVLYFVSDRGVFASLNQGKTWYNVDYNLPTLVLNSMEIYNNVCYVTTQGSGIWYSPQLYNLTFFKNLPVLTGYLPSNGSLNINGEPVKKYGFFLVYLKPGLNTITTNRTYYLDAAPGKVYYFNFSNLQRFLNINEIGLPEGIQWNMVINGKDYNMTGNCTVTIPQNVNSIYVLPVGTDYSIYYPFKNFYAVNSSLIIDLTIQFSQYVEAKYINLSSYVKNIFWTTQIAYSSGYIAYGGGGDMAILKISNMNVKDIGNPFPDGQVYSVSSYENGFIIGGSLSPDRPGLSYYDLKTGTFQSLSALLPLNWSGPFAKISSVFAINNDSFGFIGGASGSTFFGIVKNGRLVNLVPYLPSYFIPHSGSYYTYSAAYLSAYNSIIISDGYNFGAFYMSNDSFRDLDAQLQFPVYVGYFPQYTPSSAFISSDGNLAVITGVDLSSGLPFVLTYSPSKGLSDISSAFPGGEYFDTVTWDGNAFVLSGIMENSQLPYLVIYDPERNSVTAVNITASGNIVDSATGTGNSFYYTTFYSIPVPNENYVIDKSYYGLAELTPTG